MMVYLWKFDNTYFLQQKISLLEQELRNTKNSLNESISENKNLEVKLSSINKEKNKLERNQKKRKKIASTKVTAIKKRKSKKRIDWNTF